MISEELESVKRELQNEEGKLERAKVKKEKLFHRLMDNQIDDDEYMKLSIDLEREEMELVDLVKALKKEVRKITSKKKEKECALNTYKDLGKIKAIDRDVVDRFIEKIIISKEGRIELEWKFENIFQDTKSA